MTPFETFQLVLLALVAVAFGLSALARRHPHVGWLQAFRWEPPQLSDAQRARMRRRANVHAGVQLILLGLAVPLGYIVLTVMFFNTFTAGWIALTAVIALVCIALGITAIARSGRS